MSISVGYAGTSILQGIQPTSIECVQLADMGETATGAFTVEDDAAALTLIGYQPVTISESACSQPRLFTGWTYERGYQRDEENAILTSAARTHDVSIIDMNACFGFRQITRTGTGGGNRPAETWLQRLTWILGSEYLSPYISSSQAFVIANTTAMDAADYRGSYPSAVMNDLSDRSGNAYDYFAFWDPLAKEVRLFFNNDTASIGDSVLRISNVLSEQDQVTTFGPDKIAKLQRESDQVYSDVCVNYADGTLKLYRSRPSTYATFVRRSTQIDRPYTRSVATATLQADAWLTKHSVETDRVTCTIRVPRARVGLIQAGQRVQFKAPHMPNYSAFTWMRVVMCTPKPADETATLYDIALELVYRPTASVVGGCVAVDAFSGFVTAGPTVYGTATPTISITPTAGQPCVVIGLAMSANHNTPPDTDWVSGAGYTTLFESEAHGGTGHPLMAVLYKAVASASGAYTPNGDFTPGYDGTTDSRWGMAALAIASSDATPVQDAWAIHPASEAAPRATLGSAPTVGNGFLMVVFIRDYYLYGGGGNPFTPYPTDGRWSLLGTFDTWMDANGQFGQGLDRAFVYARCIEAGDGTAYGLVAPSKSTGISLSEWTVDTNADVVIDLGPAPATTPPGTTPHTTDPTVDDDGPAGYGVGAVWVNTTSRSVWVNTDNTDGAAVWVQTSGGGGTGFVFNTMGGKEVVSTVAAAGATETIVLTDGNVFDITTTADLTLTFSGATAGVACSFTLLLRQDGTGGWTTTWPISVVWAGGSAPTLNQTASSLSVLTFVTVDGGTVWLGFPTGASGGTPATTVTDETTWGITPAVGSDTEYARQDHTHGSAANPVTAVAVAALGFVGPILVSDTPSTPLVFADLIQNEAEDDLVYGDI